jgi:hypothetical protein
MEIGCARKAFRSLKFWTSISFYIYSPTDKREDITKEYRALTQTYQTALQENTNHIPQSHIHHPTHPTPAPDTKPQVSSPLHSTPKQTTHHLPIHPPPPQQPLMIPLLQDPPTPQHKDHIRLLNRRQAMRNRNDRPPPLARRPLNRLLHQRLRLRVQRRRRLIEQEEFRFAQERAGKR